MIWKRFLYLLAAGTACWATAATSQERNTLQDLGRGDSRLSLLPSTFFDPRAYGAFGDGASHTAKATIGAMTLAGVASYIVEGRQPYGWIKSYPAGVLFNLDPETASAPGAKEISFRTEAIVGVRIAMLRAEASGSRTVTRACWLGLTPLRLPSLEADLDVDRAARRRDSVGPKVLCNLEKNIWATTA